MCRYAQYDTLRDCVANDIASVLIINLNTFTTCTFYTRLFRLILRYIEVVEILLIFVLRSCYFLGTPKPTASK